MYIQNINEIIIRIMLVDFFFHDRLFPLIRFLIFNSKYLITLDEFGASGKKQDVHKKYGFDVDSLEEKIENLLK